MTYFWIYIRTNQLSDSKRGSSKRFDRLQYEALDGILLLKRESKIERKLFARLYGYDMNEWISNIYDPKTRIIEWKWLNFNILFSSGKYLVHLSSIWEYKSEFLSNQNGTYIEKWYYNSDRRPNFCIRNQIYDKK